MAFERNYGQTVPSVNFLARFRGYTVFLMRGGGAIVRHSSPIHLRPLFGSEQPELEGTRKLNTLVNYFLGSDPSMWRRNIPTFAEVRCRSIWPGITAAYHGTRMGQLEIDFIVEPGAETDLIRFAIDGADRLELTASGDIAVSAGHEEVCLRKPVLYQEHAGRRIEIEGGYMLTGDGIVGFTVGCYDTASELVIDPVVVYSTYLGGSETDQAMSIAVDAAGHAYVAGSTRSLDFPIEDAYQPAHGGGGSDGFVAKLNPAGTELVYSTYLGGRGSDECNAIAVDSDRNVYVAGSTSSNNFPTTPGAFQTTQGGRGDAFVAKLNPAGDDPVFCTLLGGSGFDQALDVAVDQFGAVYVTGSTASTDFPREAALQEDLAGGDDAFVTKLAADGQSLVFSTFLGGSAEDLGQSIAVDSEGAVYVAGRTRSDDFRTENALQPALGGGIDAFVAKLTSAGDELVYSTYLGGSGNEAADGGCHVAVDHEQAIILTSTVSEDFPTVDALQPTFGGDRDVAVAKLAADGGSLIFSTYLGGPLESEAHGLAVDGYGNIVITGFAHEGFPMVDPIQENEGGSGDGFVSMLTGDGSILLFSTFLGGSQTDLPTGVALDPQGQIYISGSTLSDDFPTTTGALQPDFGGGTRDGFVVRLIGRPVYPYEYAAMVVSGIQDDPGSRRLARGAYATTVNIHNPNSDTVTFFKKLALTYPPAEQRPGEIFPIATHRLGPDETLKSDGDEIAARLFPNGLPAPVIQGFLVVQCERPLDVTAVYTTSELDPMGQVADHSGMHVEQVRERIRQADVSIEKAGFVAGRLEIESGVFLAAILYIIEVVNNGPFTAQEIEITDILKSENAVVYVLEQIDPFVEPAGMFTIESQTFVESEISVRIPELPMGETALVAFWALALFTNTLGVPRLVDRASVFHSVVDPFPQNNSTQITTQLWP